MKKSLITLAIGTIAATALLGACGDDDKSSDGGSSDTAAAGTHVRLPVRTPATTTEAIAACIPLDTSFSLFSNRAPPRSV